MRRDAALSVLERRPVAQPDQREELIQLSVRVDGQRAAAQLTRADGPRTHNWSKHNAHRIRVQSLHLSEIAATSSAVGRVCRAGWPRSASLADLFCGAFTPDEIEPVDRRGCRARRVRDALVLATRPFPALDVGPLKHRACPWRNRRAFKRSPRSPARVSDATNASGCCRCSSRGPHGRSRTFCRSLLFGEFRQGALEGVVLEAVANSAELPAAALRRAVLMAGSLASGRAARR